MIHGTTTVARWAVIPALAFAALTGLLVSCGGDEQMEATDVGLADELVGTWFAYRANFIENMWTFRRDGTCSNDGWPDGPIKPDRTVPPYHLDGTYNVYSNRVEVYVEIGEGMSDTLLLSDPKITFNRLVYTSANFPVVFLRERAAMGQGYVGATEERPEAMLDAANIVGDWVAFAGGYPANTWQFNDDGTFVNTGWAPLDPRTILIRRLYQVNGSYTVTGQRILLTNGDVRRFDPATNQLIGEPEGLDEEIVLYNAAVLNERLVYTNIEGLPVVFRHGAVTPTNW